MPEDVTPNPERENILARSPMLATFFRLPEGKIVPGRFNRELDPIAAPLRSELHQTFGPLWGELGLNIARVSLNEIGIFARGNPQEEINAITEALFLIGYETSSNPQELFSLNSDIISKLLKLSLLYQLANEDSDFKTKMPAEQYGNQVLATVWGLIRAGNYTKFLSNDLSRKHPKSDNTQPSEHTEIPDTFKRFLDTLDLS